MKLREELEDLRKADHESVVAEISILTFKSYGENGGKGKRKTVVPFVILDHDDCSAFCEIFLNRCGHLQSYQDSSQNSHEMDVPLLLCRHLGPFPWMTLCNVSSSYDQKDSTENTDDAHVRVATTTLFGHILPCGLNDIIAACSSHFCLHKEESHDLTELRNSNNECDSKLEDCVGSHYFMMHLRAMEGSSDPTKSTHKIIGTRSSGSKTASQFNSVGYSVCNATKEVHEPKNAHVSTLVVWDVNRPDTLTILDDHCENQEYRFL